MCNFAVKYNPRLMEKHDFVTIADLTREKILYMIEMAQEFERHPNRELLKGKVVATLFFEPSTRTRLSFETAAKAFNDPTAVIIYDEDHSTTEERYNLIGAVEGGILFIVYTMRDETIRMISARPANNAHNRNLLLSRYPLHLASRTAKTL